MRRGEGERERERRLGSLLFKIGIKGEIGFILNKKLTKRMIEKFHCPSSMDLKLGFWKKKKRGVGEGGGDALGMLWMYV